MTLLPTDPVTTLEAYVRQFGGGASDPVTVVTRSRCSGCDGYVFTLRCSEEEGVAERTCTICKRAVFIGDSEEHWHTADVGDATCPCGKQQFYISVGYCVNEDGDVVWMIVGAICLACSTPGVYADWCIDYTPNEHLLDQA
jgi:hypothetical protein